MSDKKRKMVSIRELRSDLLLFTRACSTDENRSFRKMRKSKQELPDGVVYDEDEETFRIDEEIAVESEDDVDRVVQYRMLQQLNKIAENTDSLRSMVKFFTVLTVIGLIISLISGILASINIH